MTVCNPINKQAVARAFNRAAHRYDHYSVLQKKVGHTLLDFSNNDHEKYRTVFDAGAGTGYFSHYFQRAGSIVTVGDLALDMIKQAQKKQTATHYVMCDMEALPFADQQFCATFSNLALQWCPNIDKALTQLCRVTQKRVLFTTLILGSLHELTLVGKTFDGYSRSNNFLSLAAILDAYPKKTLRWQIRSHVLYYSSLLDLFSDLKGTGANYMPNLTSNRRYCRNYLVSLEKIYLSHFGRLQLTYRVFYGLIDLWS